MISTKFPKRISLFTKVQSVESPLKICQRFRDHKAITDQHGSHTYGEIWKRSVALASELKKQSGSASLEGQRVTYLTDNDSSNTVVRWATWLNRAIAVPLCAAHPTAEKRYFVEDSRAKFIVATEKYSDELTKLAKENGGCNKLILPDNPCLSSSTHTNYESDLTTSFNDNDNCLIMYTSGTTGRPKGVVHTHGSINANALDLINSWEWQSTDVVLHTLPLHHIHGLLKLQIVPQTLGGHCVMLPKFDAKSVWQKLLDKDAGITLFSAVPTIYAKLLQYLDEHSDDPVLSVDRIESACASIRLMISGSAPLPTPAADRWHRLTGHRILDRYGMTETLLVLTNPYSGKRKTGTVGHPFPSFTTTIAQEDKSAAHGYVDVSDIRSTDHPGRSMEGELLVKGPTLFKEYWNKPEATKEAFTPDGWFKTGDTVCKDEDGYYRILGRTSVDIIKSGGYKISALDIESKILQRSDVSECAVIGLPDPVYGEIVGVILVLKPDAEFTTERFLDWCTEILPKYQIPRTVKLQAGLPKNAMGKINKKMLVSTFNSDVS